MTTPQPPNMITPTIKSNSQRDTWTGNGSHTHTHTHARSVPRAGARPWQRVVRVLVDRLSQKQFVAMARHAHALGVARLLNFRVLARVGGGRRNVAKSVRNMGCVNNNRRHIESRATSFRFNIITKFAQIPLEDAAIITIHNAQKHAHHKAKTREAQPNPHHDQRVGVRRTAN